MPHSSRRSYSPPPRVAAAAGRTPPSGRGRPRAASPRRDRRLDRRLDHRRASRKRSRRSRWRRRRGTSSGRRVSRAHARSARVARGSRSRRSKRPAPACRARAGSWRGREEGTRRGQTGRRWANPGGDARWRGRRSRERRAGSSVGGRTSRIVARSKGALAPPRRARRDAPSLKGRAHRSEDVALFSRKEMSRTDRQTRVARRFRRTRPILDCFPTSVIVRLGAGSPPARHGDGLRPREGARRYVDPRADRQVRHGRPPPPGPRRKRPR